MKTFDTGPECVEIGLMELTLARSVAGVASELRMSDVKFLVNMIHNDEARHIADLVASSAELHFKKGALRYALVANYELSWRSAPVVELDMEFQHDEIVAYFKFRLGQNHAEVSLIHLWCHPEKARQRGRADALSSALRAAALSQV